MNKSNTAAVLQWLEIQWDLMRDKCPEWGYDTLLFINEICVEAKLSDEEKSTVLHAFIGYVLGLEDMSAIRLMRLFEFWKDKTPDTEEERIFRWEILDTIREEFAAFKRA